MKKQEAMVDWEREAQRVEDEAKLVASREWKTNGVPRGARKAYLEAEKGQLPVALVLDEKLGYCVIVTQELISGRLGPHLAYKQYPKHALYQKPFKKRTAAPPNKPRSCLCDWCRGRDLVRGPDCTSRRGYSGEERKIVRVVVEGAAGSGKTTIMLAIANAMRDLGFKGNVEDDDYTDEALMKFAKTNHKRIGSLVRNGTILEVRSRHIPRSNKRNRGVW